MSERAATVIPLPLSVVESNIWDVTSWPTFMGSLAWVERTAHERYLFGVREGRRVLEVPVAVRWHARHHQVTWRETSGPEWRGEIRLTPMNGRRTKVILEVAERPRTLLGNAVDLLSGHHGDLEQDIERLRERLATIPQPLNPARLRPVRQIARQPVRTPANCD